MGAASRPPPARRPRRSARRGRQRRAARAASSASRSQAYFAARARRRSARARSELVVRAARPRRRRRRSRSAAARCCRERVRAALRRHTVVLLDVDVETRVGARAPASGRPLARDRDGVRALLRRARAALYEDARRRDRARRRRPRDVARRALRRCATRPQGARLLWATTRVGRLPGLRRRGAAGARAVAGAGRRFVVTDETVARAATAARARRRCGADRDRRRARQHKTLATAERVWTRAGRPRA